MNRKERRSFKRKGSDKNLDTERYIFKNMFFSDSNNLDKIMKWISSDVSISNLFDKYVIHKSLADFNKINYTVNKDQDADLSFYMAYSIINVYIDYIIKYIKLKSQYEKNFFGMNYKGCLITLQQIEKELGYSIWGFSQKFKILELICGLSENKKNLSEFSGKCKNNVFITTLLQFLSNKAEQNISYSNYTTSIKKYFRSIDDPYLTSYFNFKLNPEYVTDIKRDNIPLFFQLDMRNSIIDLYEDFIKLIQYSSEEIFNSFDSIYLYEATQDSRILNVSVYYNKYREESLYSHFEENKFFLMINDLYTVGDYEKCKIALEFYINYYPDNFQAKILLAKVCIHLNIEPNNEKIVYDIYNIYNYNSNYDQCIKTLYQYILYYSDTKWESKILYFINHAGKNKSDFLQTLSFLNDDILTPGFSIILKGSNKNRFLAYIKEYTLQTTNLYSQDFMNPNVLANSKEIDKMRGYFYLIKSYIYKESFDEALFFLNEVTSIEEVICNYYQEKVYRYTLLCFEKRKKINEFVDLTVFIFISNKFYLERVPLKSVSNEVLKTKDLKIKRNALTSIFIYISGDIKQIRKAFSNFIDSNNIENVDDLLKYDFNNKDIEEFFLINICTIDIMKRDYKFGLNIEEVYNSRLKILKQVISIRNDNKKYMDEMMEITSKMKIKEQTKQINNSRIFVDIEGIRKENSLFLKEDFDKYIFLKEYDSELTGIDLNDEKYLDKFKQIYDETTNRSQQDVNYKQNLILLKSILARITEEFLFNSKYGLDTFLSARIRHGYCKDQLTKAFKTAHLLSKKTEDKIDEYLVNEYWDMELEEYPNQVKNLVKKELSCFTNKIEEKVHEIKDKWIRIKVNENDVGLFDYTQFVEVNSIIIDRENRISDFNLFYNSVFTYLWSWTDEYLTIIRKKIKEELYDYFVESLNNLEKSIDSDEHHCTRLSSKFKNQITLCKTEIAKLVEEFSGVFFKNDIEYNDFKISDVIFTCEQLFQQLYPSFDQIGFTKDIRYECMFKGKYFPYFIDVFNILISNCIQHSAIDKFCDLKICIIISEIGCNEQKEIIKSFQENKLNVKDSHTILKLSIENNLSRTIDYERLKIEVDSVFNKFNNKDIAAFKEYTQSEGGTGFLKLTSILKYNMNTTHLIAYNIDKGNASFKISIYMVIKKGDNENENIIC